MAQCSFKPRTGPKGPLGNCITSKDIQLSESARLPVIQVKYMKPCVLDIISK